MAGRRKTSVILMAVLCMIVTLTTSTFAAGSSALSGIAEDSAEGGRGSSCGEFTNGFAVGMGIATLFGCAWCAAAGLGAKAFAILLC